MQKKIGIFSRFILAMCFFYLLLHCFSCTPAGIMVQAEPEDNLLKSSIAFEVQQDIFWQIYVMDADGKIVEATSTSEPEKLNSFLDTDGGSRYTGEFAIGVNPYITKPMKDALFDEKIAGSFHLTPGKCYDEASNGNKSALHWDMICVQTPEYGGGERYFDNVLIRKDGLFVVPELECLNPENLK